MSRAQPRSVAPGTRADHVPDRTLHAEHKGRGERVGPQQPRLYGDLSLPTPQFVHAQVVQRDAAALDSLHRERLAGKPRDDVIQGLPTVARAVRVEGFMEVSHPRAPRFIHLP